MLASTPECSLQRLNANYREPHSSVPVQYNINGQLHVTPPPPLSSQVMALEIRKRIAREGQGLSQAGGSVASVPLGGDIKKVRTRPPCCRG